MRNPVEELQLVQKKYPNLGKWVNHFQDLKREKKLDWPQWCFMPMKTDFVRARFPAGRPTAGTIRFHARHYDAALGRRLAVDLQNPFYPCTGMLNCDTPQSASVMPEVTTSPQGISLLLPAVLGAFFNNASTILFPVMGHKSSLCLK